MRAWVILPRSFPCAGRALARAPPCARPAVPSSAAVILSNREGMLMSLMTVFSVSIRPGRSGRYEAGVHRVAERAVAEKAPFEWAAHQVMIGPLGTIHYTSECRDWAALATREPVDAMVRRLMGDTVGTQLIEELSECITAERYTVGQERADLSFPPDPHGAMRAFGVVTLLRARPGGEDAIEELIRKVAQAIPAVKDPRRFTAYQTVAGNMRTYWAVVPLDDIAEIDGFVPLPELLQRAFGAEGALIYRTGMNALETMERQITVLRPELSNGAWVPSFLTRAAAARPRPGVSTAAH